MIVVIDALRADFVLPDDVIETELGSKQKQRRHKIEYLHDLIAKDEQIAFLSRANAPTVTMPRLKVSSRTSVRTKSKPLLIEKHWKINKNSILEKKMSNRVAIRAMLLIKHFNLTDFLWIRHLRAEPFRVSLTLFSILVPKS